LLIRADSTHGQLDAGTQGKIYQDLVATQYLTIYVDDNESVII
jgi:hypothetical protein